MTTAPRLISAQRKGMMEFTDHLRIHGMVLIRPVQPQPVSTPIFI